MEKKHIENRVAVKGLINGFIAYGVLLAFLFISLVVFVSWLLNKYQDSINYDVLKYTLPVFAAFLAFFLIRLVCRLSTYDLFKKCKVDKKDERKISSKMNFFFIGCVIISVVLILFILNVRFNNQKMDIEQASQEYYDDFPPSFAEYLTIEMISDFRVDRAVTLIQVIIIEIGLLFGLFSLISTQKKFIGRYNTGEDDKSDEIQKSSEQKNETKKENTKKTEPKSRKESTKRTSKKNIKKEKSSD